MRMPDAIAERVTDILARLQERWLSRNLQGAESGRGAGARRILIIDDMVPDPLFGAGYPRAYAIVRALVEAGYQVDLYPMVATPAHLSRMHAIFAGAIRVHSAKGARGLRRLLLREGATFDVLFISRPTPMRTYVGLRWRPGGHASTPPVIYDAEALLASLEKRRRELYGPAWSDRAYQAALTAELGRARGAAAITSVGPGDAGTIRSALDVPVFVLPHSVAARTGTPGFEGRQDLLFVGRLAGSASYSPNVDAVRWFAAEVMPALDRLIGSGYRVHLVGWVKSPEVQSLASHRIVVHGVVEDLRSLYDQCRLFVAPTRFASGIPLKVIEAMSEGIPCVVTTLLAEQLDASKAALAIADGASHFAEACARLYTDAVAWEAIRDGGVAHVARAFSPFAFTHSLTEVLDHVTCPEAV